MAREIIDLTAEVRTGTGKGAARQARRDGYVPGIIYGDGQEPIAIKMKFNYLLTKLRQGRFLQSLFNLKVEGQPDVHVICRGVQRDVVKDMPTHVDFMRVHDESRIELFVHVTFINHEASPGLKRGGTLTVVRHEVELEVTAGDIPDHITVDLTGKVIGDVIHIDDVVLPEGARATINRNFVIANVAAPAGLAAAVEEDATA
ncbi:50S ribosomal protein L25/general stress protein Ctc [Paracoccaceae bacterium]|jgi:large subunit ribosomal protein L25